MIWKQKELSENYQHFLDNGYGELTAAALCNAGIRDLQSAEKFLNDEEILNPGDIKNIDKVSAIIWKHIYAKNRICIYGDYDADGVTASAIMFLALKKLKANPVVRLPDRITEGYGINKKVIMEQIEQGTKLFITVDNGIRAVDEIELIKSFGLDAIVLDHHEPGEILPKADAVIDLHIEGETYPFTELTGSGLAWKVSLYMLEQADEYEFAMSLVDLAAIGTIGDVAPLVGENRAIVKRAIKLMRSPEYNRQGVRAILGDLSHVTAENIAYQLAPCINASGRLNGRGAELPLILLLETDEKIVNILAGKMIIENDRRKDLQSNCYKQARLISENMISNGDKIIVLCLENAQSGIAGLIAGNLKEEFNRPTIVFCPKTDLDGEIVWTGSARSISGFHILEAITACSEHLATFGGHSMAAGLTIEASAEKLDLFRKAINEYADFLTDDLLAPVGFWDLSYSEEKITEDLYDEMLALEPFGAGVPKPILKIDVCLDENNSHKIMGASREHIKLFTKKLSLVGFSLAEKYIKAQLPQKITAYGSLSFNIFNGEIHKEIMLKDFEH